MRQLRIVPGGRAHRASALPNSIAPALPAVDDATLVAEVKAGNPAVADAFCQRILPVVDRTVRRLLGRDESEREDLAQIAIIELVKSIGRFREESSLDTWVSAVTAHVVYKQIRRRPLERHVSLDLVEDELLQSMRPTGEAVCAAREALSRVLRHLDAVGEKLAWSFILHDVLGHSLTEVAAIMGVSEAAAQSRLVRGRARLHERIEGDRELAELFVDLERLVR